MANLSLPPVLDKDGEMIWKKLDIDLQGENLHAHYQTLREGLLRSRALKELSKEQLSDLAADARVVRFLIESLLQRIEYVAKHPHEQLVPM